MRRCRVPSCLLAAACASAIPAAAHPADRTAAIGAIGAPAPIRSEDAVALAIRDEAGGALKRFYAERGFRPLWARGGAIGGSADTLVDYLAAAGLDGLKRSAYGVDDLRKTVAAARTGDPRSIARAELRLSKAFARYARDQRRARGGGPGDARMTYADRDLKPKELRPEGVLRAAAFPGSFDAYVAGMEWMSARYVGLRRQIGLAARAGAPRGIMARLRLNLDRARLLPGPWTRHVVVDASSGRLWYYEAGREVGAMRVVVGAQKTQTPMLAGTLQWAILNPYWNVPDYLVRDSIAPKVLAGRSLASLRMEALSDWSAAPQTLSASAIDWHAVAAGEREVRLRERPGAGNSMGRVKFLFPNDQGIYLHDTPNRDLLQRPDRHLSNGCIRLENAAALGRWLLQRPLRAASGAPEQAVPIPVGVPVYLTYLTAIAGGEVAFREDVYGRDG